MIWPFKPRTPFIETLEWNTDIFRAKAAEQRAALRLVPVRTFQMSHLLSDEQYARARDLVRVNESFMVPDWAQSQQIGSVAAGSSVVLSGDLSFVEMGDNALLWEPGQYEQVELSGLTADTVVNTYSNARLVPLWPAHAPEGLQVTRGAARINEASIAFVLDDGSDLSATDYPQYRDHDVMTTCPVIGSGSFDERIVWPVSTFDNQTGVRAYIRQRTIPDLTMQMRWHEFSKAELWDLRKWLHSRKGRQKAFWLSSRGKDINPTAISGTSVTASVGRPAPFDVDILSGGVNYYRRVTNVSGSTLTLDTSVPVTSAERISYLRCVRFDADRIELEHEAAGGTAVQVPCIEIPVP
jgi:hypothetical protein